MTNEVTLLVQRTIPVNFTCSDSTGIEKGTLLALTDPNTAIKASAKNQAVAGVCMVEKIANSGVTSVSVCRGPGDIFKMTLSGSATIGDALVLSDGGTNLVESAAVNAENILGTALETGTNGETIRVELNIRGINLA